MPQAQMFTQICTGVLPFDQCLLLIVEKQRFSHYKSTVQTWKRHSWHNHLFKKITQNKTVIFQESHKWRANWTQSHRKYLRVFIKILRTTHLQHPEWGLSGRVVTLSPSTFEIGVPFLAQYQVGMLVSSLQYRTLTNCMYWFPTTLRNMTFTVLKAT